MAMDELDDAVRQAIERAQQYEPAIWLETLLRLPQFAAMREIVEAVAGMRVEDGIFDQPYYALMHPDHERDANWHQQLVTKARRLLGK